MSTGTAEAVTVRGSAREPTTTMDWVYPFSSTCRSSGGRFMARISSTDMSRARLSSSYCSSVRSSCAITGIVRVMRISKVAATILNWIIFEDFLPNYDHVSRRRRHLSCPYAELGAGARGTFVSGGGRHAGRIDLPPGLPRVMADRQRTVQVLNNLLANAGRHSPESARIRIAAEREGLHVAVSVADEGRGIAPDHLGQLFRKYTAAGDRKGGGCDVGHGGDNPENSREWGGQGGEEFIDESGHVARCGDGERLGGSGGGPVKFRQFEPDRRGRTRRIGQGKAGSDGSVGFGKDPSFQNGRGGRASQRQPFAWLRPSARAFLVARPHLHLIERGRLQPRQRGGPSRPFVRRIDEETARPFPALHVIIGNGRPGILRFGPFHRC